MSSAYVYNINPIGSGAGEDGSVHQVSPAWVLTFVRWNNRDTYRTPKVTSTEVRDPLVVENDCVSCSTSFNKGTLTPSMTATLVMTDINYETSVAPGDFVFVNMLNWEQDARRVADNARGKAPINGPYDGFKGLYKVQSVRKTLNTDPQTGTKYYLFNITGFGFTEFNNAIYFNPYMFDSGTDEQTSALFCAAISSNWSALANKRGFTNVQVLITELIKNFLGTGVHNVEGAGIKSDSAGNIRNFNTHFYLPPLVGKYLNVRNAKAAKDAYNYVFGIQKYSGSPNSNVATGMNPQGLQLGVGRFYSTKVPCEGDSALKPEFWNNVKTWSILNQYVNSPLNEMYTCFRISPSGNIMPTVVFRQIPFTTEDFKAVSTVTRFLNLPRWRVHPSLVESFDLGREEAARINFVQVFASSTVDTSGSSLSLEIASKNYTYDIRDVRRSGLRPYIVSTQFNEPPDKANLAFKSPIWAGIIGDSLIGGHLKMNGTINLAGIVDPITIGDNFEFDSTVYHIEAVTHTCSISSENGIKTFNTVLSLSSGVDISSNANGTRYSEMVDPKAQQKRIDDFSEEKLLPGTTESQDTVYRVINPDIDDKGAYSPKNNNPFPQPNTKKGGKK
jgi:hypothetical protein